MTLPQPAILHLTTVHNRVDVRIFHKQCCTLAAAGYQVTLLVADGLGAQTLQGVHIVDLGRRPPGRLVRMTLLPWRALREVLRRRPKVVHFHDPELLPIAWLLRKRGIQVIYDVHEDVPQQILAKYWLAPWLRAGVSNVFSKFETWVARQLRAVVVAAPPLLPRFVALGCTDAICVNNFPLLHEFPAPTGEKRRARTLAYIGGLTRARGLVQLVQALSLMPDVRLLLCGTFAHDGCEAACRALPGWSQVEFFGHVDRPAIQNVLATAEIGMVTLLPEPNYLVALPVKMFEYMAAGLPVVASNIALWQTIVETQRCGVTVNPADPAAIAQAVLALLQNPNRSAMGARGREAVLSQYHWGCEAEKLLALYARVCAGLTKR
jgi:glycosyltransferase involved in cell wall biosynthesis